MPTAALISISILHFCFRSLYIHLVHCTVQYPRSIVKFTKAMIPHFRINFQSHDI